MKSKEKLSLALLIPSASAMATFISPALISIKNHFHVLGTQLSSVMTVYLIGYLLGQIVWAYYSNRIGRLLSIKSGALLSIVGAVIILFATKMHFFDLFLLGRFVLALGLSAGLICGFAIVKENFLEYEEKRFLSIMAVVFTVSIYISMLVSGCLMKFDSLELITYAILFYSIVIFCLSFTIKSNLKQPKAVFYAEKERNIDPDLIWNRSHLIVYSCALSITTIIAYCYAFYAPLITHELFLLSPTAFSSYNLLNIVAIFTGSFLFSRLSSKYSEVSIIIFGLFVIVLSNLIILAITYNHSSLSMQSFFSICYLINLSCGMIYPAATYLALEYGICKATSSAIMNLIKLGAPVVALLISNQLLTTNLNSFSMTILLFSIISLMGLYMITLVPLRREAH